MMDIITSVMIEQKIIWFAKKYISSIFFLGLNIQEIFQGISSGDLKFFQSMKKFLLIRYNLN